MRQNSPGELLIGDWDLPVRPKNERCDDTPGPPERERHEECIAPAGRGREVRQRKHKAEERPCQGRKRNVAGTGLHPLFAGHRVCHFAAR